MTSLSISKIKKHRQKLESEGFIQYNKDKGSYKYQIKTLPSGTDKITLRDNVNNPMGTLCQGAKETIKENLKKDILFLEFKKKYPENKFDDDTAFDAWQSLTDADKQLVVGVMEYQNNGWADIDRKYIPKASNYLLKRKFLDDSVHDPYESEIRREKAIIKQREYYQKADQNSATPEEIKAILQNDLKPGD